MVSYKIDPWAAPQVRDGACLATASCVLTFPEQCRGELPLLYPLWIRQLDDNVWSVRAHAAMALADVVRAYQQDALDVVLPHLRYIDPCANPLCQPLVLILAPTLALTTCADCRLDPLVHIAFVWIKGRSIFLFYLGDIEKG